MTTLIIPCGGKSTRFPGMRPKYLLTDPSGELMVRKSIEKMDIACFDKIVIAIVKEHDVLYEAKLILEQAFNDLTNVEICVLPTFTKSASDTVKQTIVRTNINGPIVVKDADNQMSFDQSFIGTDFVVGLEVGKNSIVNNIQQKSFIKVNEQGVITNIVEKNIISNIICIGVYGFKSSEEFLNTVEILETSNLKGEIYLSNVIAYLISKNTFIFRYSPADSYEDWGTLVEWNKYKEKYNTYFVDVDGVLLKNCGKYGKVNWSNNADVLEDNIKKIIELQKNGAQIVITTSRPKENMEFLGAIFKKYNFKPDYILNGLNHSRRIIINDFAPTNPYPSCKAISIPRNSNIKAYL